MDPREIIDWLNEILYDEQSFDLDEDGDNPLEEIAIKGEMPANHFRKYFMPTYRGRKSVQYYFRTDNIGHRGLLMRCEADDHRWFSSISTTKTANKLLEMIIDGSIKEAYELDE